MKNEKIESALDCAVLTEERADAVFGRIVASAENKPQRRSQKRLAFALIVMTAVIIVAGTVIAGGAKAKQTAVINGQYSAESDSADTQSAKYGVYGEEWINEHSSYTMLAIKADNESADIYGLSIRVEDYELLKSMVSSESTLKLPQYLPDGFKFSSALISLYITEEDAKAAVQPEKAFMDGGTVYQCFQFTEDIVNNVESVYATYSNGRGEHIKFTACLENSQWTSYIQPYLKIHTADIKGYDKVVYYTDSKQKTCRAKRYIDAIEYLEPDALGAEERADMLGTKPLYTGDACYNVETYSVSSETVSTDELISIIEGIG